MFHYYWFLIIVFISPNINYKIMFLAHFVMLKICFLSDGNTNLHIHINTCHWWPFLEVGSDYFLTLFKTIVHLHVSRRGTLNCCHCLTTSGVHYLHFLLREGPDEGQCVISHYIFIKTYLYICVYLAHSAGLYGNSGKAVRTLIPERLFVKHKS